MFGLHLGIPGVMESSLRRDASLSTAQWAAVVSFVTLGAAFGSLLAGASLSERLGRRRTLLLANALLLTSPFLLFLPSTSPSSPSSSSSSSSSSFGFPLLLVSRLLTGVAVGLVSVVVSPFITEMSPQHLRGSLGMVTQLSIVSGIFLSYLTAFGEIEDENAWMYLLATAMAAGLVQVVLLITCVPDSPRFLLAKGNEDGARASLARLWSVHVHSPLVDASIESMQAEIDAVAAAIAAAKTSVMALDGSVATEEPRVSTWAALKGWMGELTAPAVRRCVSIAIGLQFFQQMTGVNAIVFYSSSIFRDAGFTSATQQATATVLVGATLVVVTVASVPFVERAGRKILCVVSAFGGALAMAAMGVYTIDSVDLPNWFAVVAIMAFITFFSMFLHQPFIF